MNIRRRISLLLTGSSMAMMFLTPLTNQAACGAEPPTTVYPTRQRVPDKYSALLTPASAPHYGLYPTFNEAYAAELATSGGPMILFYEAPYIYPPGSGRPYEGEYVYQWNYASIPVPPGSGGIPPSGRITGVVVQVVVYDWVCPAGYTLPPGAVICYQSPPQSNSGYRITLSGFPAEVEPGGTVRNLRAEVTCDGKSITKDVILTVNAEQGSGGHNHISGRLNGSLNPNSGKSPLTFSFVAPAPAGDHMITARCADDSCGQDNGRAWVGYKDIVDIPASNSYALTEIVNGQTVTIGASATHPTNHHLTQEALERLVVVAEAYREIYPNNPRLHLNDASLERGGVYDIYNTWARPHQCHSRGYGIDLRANDRAGAIPLGDRQSFRERLESWGIPVGHEYSGLPQEHFHLYLLTGGCEP